MEITTLARAGEKIVRFADEINIKGARFVNT